MVLAGSIAGSTGLAVHVMVWTVTGHDFYAAQSVYTNPGKYAERLDVLTDDLNAMREAARGLIFHYAMGGDLVRNGIEASRVAEIDTRYAEQMFARIFDLSDRPLTAERPGNERLVGCCRDFTVLFLAIARHKGVPARARFGFATYFSPGWYVDHVLAEVWDAAQRRWRLVDTMMPADHVDASDGTPIDVLDVSPSRFQVAPRAWLSCRTGATDAAGYVVDPHLDVPTTKGWPYIRHNVVHDLAGLAKNEMLTWDDWGLTGLYGDLEAEQAVLLDEVAATTSRSSAPVAELRELHQRDEFRVPPRITSYSPAQRQPITVELRPSGS